MVLVVPLGNAIGACGRRAPASQAEVGLPETPAAALKAQVPAAGVGGGGLILASWGIRRGQGANGWS